MKSDQWHRIADVDESARLGTCSKCGPNVEVRYRRSKGLWACYSAVNKPRSGGTRNDPKIRRYYRLQHKYGMSEGGYHELLVKQDSKCAICRQGCSTGRPLAVDHDHDTGEVRGLLCNRCNRAIGLLLDNPESALRAAEYLTR